MKVSASGYSGTPLGKKLGVRADSRVLLLGEPLGFDPTVLGPHDVGDPHALGSGPEAGYDVVLLFCPDLATLVRLFGRAERARGTAGGVWVCWPKKASGIPTDLGERGVRRFGLDSGLVDVKVAAVDEVWSGLKFVTRLADRAGR